MFLIQVRSNTAHLNLSQPGICHSRKQKSIFWEEPKPCPVFGTSASRNSTTKDQTQQVISKLNQVWLAPTLKWKPVLT